MTVRPLSLLLITLIGCGPSASEVDVWTGGGHTLDQRAWVTGSTVDVYADANRLSGVQTDIRGDAVSGGYSDGHGGDYASAEITQPGAFEVVVTGFFGEVQQRFPLQAKDPVDYKLGVLLDDCPEYADLVLDDDPAVLEGSPELLVAPVPVDEQGAQLLGHFPFEASSMSLEVEGSWGYAYLNPTRDGTIRFEIDGETHRFDLQVVEASELVGLEIAAVPEKHGMVDESLLCALGVTADGTRVHGIQARWDDGWESQTIHAANDGDARACFDGLCATWAGPAVR